jgi:hypothetical protein
LRRRRWFLCRGLRGVPGENAAEAFAAIVTAECELTLAFAIENLQRYMGNAVAGSKVKTLRLADIGDDILDLTITEAAQCGAGLFLQRQALAALGGVNLDKGWNAIADPGEVAFCKRFLEVGGTNPKPATNQGYCQAIVACLNKQTPAADACRGVRRRRLALWCGLAAGGLCPFPLPLHGIISPGVIAGRRLRPEAASS